MKKIIAIFMISVFLFAADKKDKEQRKIQYIKDTLLYGTTKQRRGAIRRKKFIKKHKDIYIPILKKLLAEDKDLSIKINSMEILKDLGQKDITSIILKLMESEQSEMFLQRAVRVLAYFKEKKAVKPILKLIKKQSLRRNNNLLIAYIDSLGEIGGDEAGKGLAKLLEEKHINKTIKAHIVLAIGNSKYYYPDKILKIAEDENEDMIVRGYAVNALGKMNAIKTKDRLLKMLNRIKSSESDMERASHKFLYLHLIATLVRFKVKDLDSILIEGLREESPRIRMLCAKLIGEAKIKTGVPALKYKVEYDGNWRVREAAIKSLGKICTSDSKEFLENILKKMKSVRAKKIVKDALKECKKNHKSKIDKSIITD